MNAVDNTPRNQNERDMLCWYCHRQGHFKTDCRKKQADLNGGNARVNHAAQNSQEK